MAENERDLAGGSYAAVRFPERSGRSVPIVGGATDGGPLLLISGGPVCSLQNLLLVVPWVNSAPVGARQGRLAGLGWAGQAAMWC